MLTNPYQITAQKMKFSIIDFFSKCDQIRSFLWIWLHLLKKSLMQNLMFCAVHITKKGCVVGFGSIFSDKSLIQIQKSHNPRIKPWGTPASRLAYVEYWPFRTEFCFLSFREFTKVFSKLQANLFCFKLHILF